MDDLCWLNLGLIAAQDEVFKGNRQWRLFHCLNSNKRDEKLVLGERVDFRNFVRNEWRHKRFRGRHDSRVRHRQPALCRCRPVLVGGEVGAVGRAAWNSHVASRKLKGRDGRAPTLQMALVLLQPTAADINEPPAARAIHPAESPNRRGQ